MSANITPRHPLFQSALDAILVGAADYVSVEHERSASAVRNLTTGLLLLCKEKLRRMSPYDDILIYQNLMPAPDGSGGLCFVRDGDKTVDRANIEKRFKSFGVIADMKSLERVVRVRNTLEHHYMPEGMDPVRGAFVDGFRFLTSFLPDHLDVVAAEALGEEVWEMMLEQRAIYLSMMEVCRQTLQYINWDVAPSTMQELLISRGCSNCSSQLLRQLDPSNGDPFSIELKCDACRVQAQVGDWMAEVIPLYYASAAYLSMTDGDPIPYETCPECDRSTYAFDEGQCFACGFKLPANQCGRCGEGLTLDDYALESKFCGYCRHLLEKADRDD
ncbi:MAG: zinc ribbon domain-containing protein [Elusimicrobiota bacterium]|jgi:hypothetical protein